MTAEIAIMNKMAIALAADSAVTIETQDGKKVFNTVNKLFRLSKYHPIGIMIHGNAEFMNTPWETIIKVFRSHLKNLRFDSLDEYANEFIGFLANGSMVISKQAQELYFQETVYSLFLSLREKIKDEIKKHVKAHNKISEDEIRVLVSKTIETMYENWEDADTLPVVSRDYSKQDLIARREIIETILKKVFQELPLHKVDKKLLHKIVANIAIKNMFSNRSSGVVIAGFGEREIFPSLHSYLLEGTFYGKLKYREQGSGESINYNNTALIVPFAQREMVDTFVSGIDPYFQRFLDGYLAQLLKNDYPEKISKAIEANDVQRSDLRKKLEEAGKEIFDDFRQMLGAYSKEKHVDPILSIVAVLPKEELAAMAESFINLTSLKRKITIDAETVGGPIDVAVISKGDGFVWIKRKHYFRPELNPQFLSNYFTDFDKLTRKGKPQ